MAGSTSKPNVICLSLDSVRADEVSFGAGSQPTTPNLERLSSDAAVFTHAISPSTWTLPVHASLMSGLYPPEHGVISKDSELGEHPTLGELFSAEGYTLNAFSRNHWLQVGEILRGFDIDEQEWMKRHYSKVRNHLSFLLGKTGVFSEADHLYKTLFRPQPDKAVVNRACKFMRRSSKPFFLLIHLNDAHSPYLPPWSIQNQFSNSGYLEVLWNQLYEQYRVYQNQDQYWAENWTPIHDTSKLIRELYRACIYHVDKLVGQVLQTLRVTRHIDNTIIAIFADHGDNFGEDGQYGHLFSLSDSVIRVPFMIYDPTDTLESGTSDVPVQINDLYPTLSRLSGIEPPETHSVDLANGSRNCAYSYHILPKNSHVDEYAEVEDSKMPPKEQFAVWKGPDSRGILYPTEDMYEGDQSLRDCISSHYQSLNILSSKKVDEIDDNVIANLRSMGYL